MEVLSVKQLAYKNNAVVRIGELVKLKTLHNNVDAVRERNSVADNDSKRLQLNTVV